ncbi:hypothetical protein [Cribrihabitans pelagius]|uniref:hypothetical protein n=1 Tax=Cribrihabitans pelagius TaxID=1765746 RepID=UPI003B597EAF
MLRDKGISQIFAPVEHFELSAGFDPPQQTFPAQIVEAAAVGDNSMLCQPRDCLIRVEVLILGEDLQLVHLPDASLMIMPQVKRRKRINRQTPIPEPSIKATIGP